MRLRATARHYLLPGTPGRYILGCDPSEGVEGGHPCAVVVLRAENWEIACVLAGLLAPHRFAEAISRLAALYAKGDVGGKPIVAIETNAFGVAVLQELRASSLNLYGSFIVSRNDYKPGFPTTPKSRENGIEQTRLAAEKWGIIAHDRELVDQQLRPGSLVYDENGKMRNTDGPDDIFMALVIACAVRAEKYGPNPMPIPTGEAKPVAKRDRWSGFWDEEEARTKGLASEATEPEWAAYA